jgi:hypothetical protein
MLVKEPLRARGQRRGLRSLDDDTHRRAPGRGEEEPTMPFDTFPASAAWRHHPARDGFEAAFFGVASGGVVLAGQTAAVEDGVAWAVGYEIEVDGRWRTRRARAWGRTADGERHVTVEGDGAGHWRVDGEPAPQLDGCLDVDLESSACTNTLPVHRLALAEGEAAASPAVYVRALDLRVERLEQRYTRRAGHYDYAAPAFDFAARLTYDAAGLVVDYPGLATRAF